MEVVFGLLIIVAIVVVIMLLKKQKTILADLKLVREKYKDVIDLDAYKDKVTAETELLIDTKNKEISKLDSDISSLKTDHELWSL